jgi:hypothetical protein
MDMSPVLVAHACNPSYSGGRHQDDGVSKPAWANRSQDAILKKSKPVTKRAGGVAQGVGQVQAPVSAKKKKKKKKKRVQVPLLQSDSHSFGYVPSSGIVGSHGRSIFSLLISLHIVFHSGYTSLHSPSSA